MSINGLTPLCQRLELRFPNQACSDANANQPYKAENTVFNALKGSLYLQHNVVESEMTIRRLFAATNREDHANNPNTFLNWAENLFADQQQSELTLQQKFAVAGLPRATLQEQDAFNPAWCLTMGNHFGAETCICILTVMNVNLPNQTTYVVIKDPNKSHQDRIVRVQHDMINIRHTNPSYVWILSINDQNLYPLKTDLRVGYDYDAPTNFSRKFTHHKRTLVENMTIVNRALAGYLSTKQIMDHEVSYFRLLDDGIATVVPFEWALDLGVDLQDFTNITVDVDMLLLRYVLLFFLFFFFIAACLYS